MVDGALGTAGVHVLLHALMEQGLDQDHVLIRHLATEDKLARVQQLKMKYAMKEIVFLVIQFAIIFFKKY
jgi:hypothetical protein